MKHKNNRVDLKKEKKKRFHRYLNICLRLFIITIFLGVGYAFTSNDILEVEGLATAIKKDPVIITDAIYYANTGADLDNSEIESYARTLLNSTITLIDHPDSSITYQITVRNRGDREVKYLETVYGNNYYDNEDITFELSGINVGDSLQPNETKTFYITFKYQEVQAHYDNRILHSCLEFKFENIEIESAYFMIYDGANSLMGFDKSTIITFQRNTTLTQQEVEEITGVQEIQNQVHDDYYSDAKVYGWVDNGDFYWWSEATTVYFHPSTLHAFKGIPNITVINLNGTSTELVENFAHFFDNDRVLISIIGTINTDGMKLQYNNSFSYENDTTNDSSSGYGMTYMFNDCKELKNVDISHLNTTNASDMKRMFAGCNKVNDLQLTHFDTRNVKSMYWMFRQTSTLTSLNLSSFDTSNVENMFGMFLNNTNLKVLTLGENFDTTKVKNMENMFYNSNKLKTIYAKTDFVRRNDLISKNMFYNNVSLVGGAGEPFETAFNSSFITSTYAQIANVNQSGYFTLDDDNNKFTITYDLDGGTASNPTIYYKDSPTFTLNQPTKNGYIFTGWTGSNGTTPQKTVTIQTGSTGNRTYIAHYTEDISSNLRTVFQVSGPCTFRGSTDNIVGENCKNTLDPNNIIDYTTGKYINSGINLYNATNYAKDFEISFYIEEYTPSNQESGETQQTFMNTKLENSSLGYPGMVIRRSGNDIEIKQTISGANVSTKFRHNNRSFVKIERINGVIYYSINGDTKTMLQDMSNFNQQFELSVWFGASANSSGNPFRYIKATLSNIKIKIEDT